MASRVACVRSWGRTAVMCWRRRAVMRSVAVMVVGQVFVAACVLSLWQLQEAHEQREQQEWPTQQEAPERVGKYVLVFKVPSAPADRATTHPTRPRPQPAPRIGYPITPSEDSLRAREKKAPSRAHNLVLGYRSTGQVKRTDSIPVWSVGEEEILKHSDNVKRKDSGDPRWKESKVEDEEEDPDVARGFLDEYVTYRSDGGSFLLVDDNRRVLRTTISIIQPSHNTSLTKDEELPKKASNDASSRLRSLSWKTDEGVEDIADQTKNYKFKSYDPTNPFKMTMRDDPEAYFQDIGGATCFIEGTDIHGSQRGGGDSCRCLEGYFGVDCGIPEAAWFDTYRNKHPETRLRRREVPRRVINGVTVNHEFAMFEARLHELYAVVDVFILAESNYTAHGDPKEFLFLERLRRGYMQSFQDKLLYVSLNTFPEASRDSGWIADAYLRFHLSTTGIPLLEDLREDDLFVLSDADELPTREVIIFLKLYDGYPEPISFALQWNVFGFFWKVSPKNTWTNWIKQTEERVSTVSSVASVGMLKKALLNNAFYIRKPGLWQHYDLYKRLKKYREEGHLVKEWVMGKAGHYAGWHCSWCLSPVNLVRKMDSAQADDKPRYGDMPEKKNLTYIALRIAQGMWFDDKEHLLPARNTKQKHYAPRFLLQHPTRYRSLLYPPSHTLNAGQPWAPP